MLNPVWGTKGHTDNLQRLLHILVSIKNMGHIIRASHARNKDMQTHVPRAFTFGRHRYFGLEIKNVLKRTVFFFTFFFAHHPQYLQSVL